MGYSKTIALLAGAAMGLTMSAQAQTLDHARAYNAEALADAGGRTSTLASMNATGPEFSGQIQFRYYLNIRDDAALVNEMTNGFQTRRSKLEAKGEIADGWSYFFQVAASFDGGGLSLQEAWVKYDISEDSNLTWGQFKAPGLREELVSSKRQLAAERSVVNETFTQDRSQGVQYAWDSENTRFRVAFTDGLDSENTDFTGESSDFSFSGRFEYKGAGDWKQFDDFTSFRTSAFAWMIGGAAHWESGGDTNGTVDGDLFQLTVDGSVEGDGWNAFAAFVYRMIDITGGTDADDMGFLVQGGYFLDPAWELFGRVDMVIPDSNYPALTGEDFTTVTVGVNHYVIPDSHAAKFTADVVYFIDALSESSAVVSADSGSGLLASGEDGQFALRFQFQLLF
ncbi:MAG: porin [Phycisphaerales bacterium]